MRYFRPILSLPEDLPADVPLVERLGGQPWGLTEDRWPRCSQCGGRQSLIAQLIHHPERLNLGREGRMLFVFQCNNDTDCDTYDDNSGANSCFVLEPEELVGSPFDSPGPIPPDDNVVTIFVWQALDDGIDEEASKILLTNGDDDEVPDFIRSKIPDGTRLGSVPFWIQGPEIPGDEWRFVAQLENTYSFFAPPNSEASWIREDKERRDGRTHYARGPNFGDNGIGYVFLKDGPTRPEGKFLWQCY